MRFAAYSVCCWCELRLYALAADGDILLSSHKTSSTLSGAVIRILFRRLAKK